MTKLSNLKIVPFVLILSNQLVLAQSVEDAVSSDYQNRITRTAEELGVSAEDLQTPVVEGVQDISAVPAEGVNKGESLSIRGMAVTVWHAISGQINDSGMVPGSSPAPSFEAISERVLAAARSAVYPARRVGQASLFLNNGFIREFESVTGASFTGGNSTRFLIDGEASFAVKDDLIRNARRSIYISSWAFYDDTTGYEAARMLIAKKNQGVEVKVIVENSVAYSHGRRVVKLMKDAGIEVLRHVDPVRSFDIWHVKMMIVDDTQAVVGGMNFGDVYSHKGSSGPKWRDTDVLYSGRAALESRRIFAQVWNDRVASMGLSFSRVAPVSATASNQGSARISVILQDPPEQSPILVSIIKAMYGATRVINIENAYVVAIPAISQAVIDARARGVEVNILTNSKDSIDSEGKSIVEAMGQGLIPMVQAGAKVYMKQGDTLHSKFMTVDGIFANIGSYNLHPRSERFDSELNVNIIGRSSVAQLDEAFAADIAAARRINSVSELEGKQGWLARIISQYFYGQLSPR